MPEPSPTLDYASKADKPTRAPPLVTNPQVRMISSAIVLVAAAIESVGSRDLLGPLLFIAAGVVFLIEFVRSYAG